MDATTLHKLAADPREFRRALKIDHGDGALRSYGDSLYDFQREIHAALDPALMAISGRGRAEAHLHALAH